ncbi:Prenylcysteine lyase-domain-containing protein [Chaetomium tenue]|uniref:Prenylcysteine lyase-domain-containing protein n=1 Tax=Chaetomium tenue TaxID=1854479 RepID=A0ACB7NZ19_9PEZI|nr:Prenylcysteine lyase-domain-containing protein [Chaetomium globosum]
MKINFRLPTIAITLLGAGLAQSTDESTRQIAIIGAGAAGSSAAHFLQQFAAEAGVHVNITLFEKTDRIGGRTRTINPFDDPAQRVEQGASIFVQANQILSNAMAEFELPPSVRDTDADPVLGIWDGDRFAFTIDQSAPSWWNILKLVWHYGVTAPQRAQQLTAATITKFLRLYEPPYFPFPSLTQRAQELELVEVTGVTGKEYLESNNVGAHYSHDLIQASTRVNYASNLANLHGLTTMVSLAAEGAIAVQGGNWQIFHEMVQKSGAQVHLDTAVVGIDKTSGASSGPAKYTVQTTSGSTPGNPTTHPTTFDNIILANPYQFSGISVGDGVLGAPIEQITYVQLHVTIFISPSPLSPLFFDLPESEKVPGMVLTTLGYGDTPTSGVDGVGKAGFFSMSILGKATNPQTQQKEYVYKVFSPEVITPEFLSRLFDATVPSDFTGEGSPISWYTPHVFNSYPKATPRVTFQDPIVGSGVYYTSGMESFISTMETNALMGKNVARLIVDEMQDNSIIKSRDGLAWEDKQSILG